MDGGNRDQLAHRQDPGAQQRRRRLADLQSTGEAQRHFTFDVAGRGCGCGGFHGRRKRSCGCYAWCRREGLCLGADISEFEAHRNSAAAEGEYHRVAAGARQALQNMGKPIIAMVQGFCIGGGCATAMFGGSSHRNARQPLRHSRRPAWCRLCHREPKGGSWP